MNALVKPSRVLTIELNFAFEISRENHANSFSGLLIQIQTSVSLSHHLNDGDINLRPCGGGYL